MKFKHITDIEGVDKKYPSSPEYTTLFCTRDLHFYIYALCTNKNLTKPDLIEITSTDYYQLRESPQHYIENLVENSEALINFLAFIDYKTDYDNLTIGETLKLD